MSSLLSLSSCTIDSICSFSLGSRHTSPPLQAFPLLSLHLEVIIQSFIAERKDAQQTPTCIITSTSLTIPHISELNVWGFFSASYPHRCKSSVFVQETTDGAYICSWLIFKDHLLQSQEWSVLETRKSHKGGLHGLTRISWKNLSGKRKNTRGGRRGRDPAEIQRQCRNELIMKTRAHLEQNLLKPRVPAGISATEQYWQCKFLQEPTCVPLKEGREFNLGQTWKQNYVSKLIYQPWSVVPMSYLHLIIFRENVVSVISRKMRCLVQIPHCFLFLNY